jgi:hypothetical protein
LTPFFSKTTEGKEINEAAYDASKLIEKKIAKYDKQM